VTFQSILQATIRFLGTEQKSFTTAQIAKVAGISVGSLYQYFPNKQAIVAKVIEVHAYESIKRLQKVLATVEGSEPIDCVGPLVSYIVEFYDERKFVLRFLYRHIFEVYREEILRKVKRDAAEALFNFLQDRKQFSNEELRSNLVLCVNAVVGVLEHYVQYDVEGFDKDNLKRQLTTLARRSVGITENPVRSITRSSLPPT
jgi:AcrR family transcriptional regulator